MVKQKDRENTQLATVELVGKESSVVEGTAVVEPQFEVLRYGHRFVRATSYKELHKALLQAEELEEQPVEIEFYFDCYPLDGIVAMNRALELVYGFTHAKERQTFFGPKPPKRLNIAISLHESVQVAYGEMAPPSWEGGSLHLYVKGASAPLTLGVSGIVKRKFEPKVKEVVEVAKMLLRTKSIYRGQPVELDLSYEGNDNFDPTNCAPKFMDVTKPVQLILPRKIEDLLNREVWNRIRRPNNFRRTDTTLKRGVLLSGVFGTGKSLTSYETARIAQENGWTYLYLKTPQNFITAYKLAQLYQPAVLFVEDCDAIFGGERTPAMQVIQETLDGVSAKTTEVITVYTTNYPARINEALKRSGRIDYEIELTKPDAEAAARFVKMMAGQWLAPDVDLVKVGEAFADLVPADIQNGIDQAKGHAIGEFMNGDEDGIDIDGKVTTDMLVLAGEIMQEKAKPTGDGMHQSERDLAIVRKAQVLLAPDGKDTLGPKIDAISGEVKKVKKFLGA